LRNVVAAEEVVSEVEEREKVGVGLEDSNSLRPAEELELAFED